MTIKTNKPFSEIIQSSLSGWLAQSWQWDTFPSFGSLVVVQSPARTLFGVVHQIQTGSMDPVRYPFPYQKTHEELLQEQPQIFEFLKTTFSCLPLGYQEKGSIVYLIAPEPPAIHSFVSLMSTDLAKQFFYNEKYLYSLFGLSGQISYLDELLLALLKQQANLGILHENKINQFTQTFSLLIGNDYRRLKLFLQRAQTIIS